jgi:hypothetical protein
LVFAKQPIASTGQVEITGEPRPIFMQHSSSSNGVRGSLVWSGTSTTTWWWWDNLLPHGFSGAIWGTSEAFQSSNWETLVGPGIPPCQAVAGSPSSQVLMKAKYQSWTSPT